ncbi:ABC transporter permease [Acidovorax sp. MR-S7]|uniref:ABC transporter permease n=1 Tax=Acidovorax sp. MR-S7 TaxID=1268622 RepID=UPI0003D3EB6C|nr:ABC transporter permease [Acidovorax sp. MR-S7]GAD21704.1 ribose/xylose/arabinose/galactoside ABC-type transport systems, permease components [Acidovorax sp. MR-S7]
MNNLTSSQLTAVGQTAGRRHLYQMVQAAKLPVVLAVLLLIFTALEPTMLSVGNLRNMLVQASYLVIFACAQMVVILVRGFDLSLGTSVSTISVASGMVMVHLAQGGTHADTAVAMGILAGIAIGAVIGAANGVVVSYLRVNPFVATFGMLNICLGLSSSLSGGFQIFDLPVTLNGIFYRSAPLGIPAPVVASVLVLAFCHILLVHTRFGRSLFILGSNPRAAAVAGHNSRALLAGAYVLCSMLVAAGALLLTARTGSGEPNLGGSLMLESIAAAVIGGISLRGGQASVAAPVMGALIITTLSAGMNLARIDGYLQQVLLGVVIVATVFLDQGRRSVR